MRSYQARALSSAERCSQFIAWVCATFQPLVRNPSRRTSSIAWMTMAITWKRS